MARVNVADVTILRLPHPGRLWVQALLACLVAGVMTLFLAGYGADCRVVDGKFGLAFSLLLSDKVLRRKRRD